MVLPRNSSSEYKPIPGKLDLDAICVAKEYRKIRSDHTFSYGNQFYLIDSPLRHSIAKQKIEIRYDNEDEFSAFFADRELAVSAVLEPAKPSMLDLEIQKKLEVLELAEKLGNVSEASRISGVSRDTIYRHRRLIREGGIEALRCQTTPEANHRNRTDQETTQTVVEFSLANTHLGQLEVANQLRKHYQIDLSASGVRNIWLRENMQTMALRLQKKEMARSTND